MTKQLKENINEWIDKSEQKAVKLLQRLVQEKSVQGSESAAQAIVVEVCRELGFQIDIWEPNFKELEKNENFISNRKDFVNSPNVVAVMKGSGSGGNSIILNGHIDVVPEGEENQWNEPPYSGVVKEGKIYGRGTTDMKGGNIALLLAMEAIQQCGVILKGDVIFQSVIEEESGGAGSLATILRNYHADAVLIPEPTNMKIFPKQQGSLWFRLKIHGRSAHGGTRYEGVSAIEKSVIVMEHVKELETMRNSKIKDPLYRNIPIPLPINIGKIAGGNWPSSVPDLVTLEGRIGVGPDETVEAVKAELANKLVSLQKEDIWFIENPVELEWFGARWLPGSIPLDHSFLQILSNNYLNVTKEKPIVEASPWGTDGGLFTNLANIPTVVFGPGVTEVAHYPNEYIEIKKMIQAAKIVASTLVDWCEVE